MTDLHIADPPRALAERLSMALCPPEQRYRWAAALKEYERVARGNVDRRTGCALTDEEWEQYKNSAQALFDSYQPGHPNSSLFQRLLSGRPPLQYPPPCAYSYPWYDVVESDEPQDNVQVAFEGERGSAMTLAEHGRAAGTSPGIGVVQIQQSIWTILERDGDTAVVTYGAWADDGYRWRLSRVEVAADHGGTGICNTHDRSKGWITTADDLMAECQRRVEAQITDMRTVAGGGTLAPADASGYAALAAGQRQAEVRARIDKRAARGWSPVPSARAVRNRIRRMFAGYLHHEGDPRPSYQVDSSGGLVKLIWRLERIAPRTRALSSNETAQARGEAATRGAHCSARADGDEDAKLDCRA